MSYLEKEDIPAPFLDPKTSLVFMCSLIGTMFSVLIFCVWCVLIRKRTNRFLNQNDEESRGGGGSRRPSPEDDGHTAMQLNSIPMQPRIALNDLNILAPPLRYSGLLAQIRMKKLAASRPDHIIAAPEPALLKTRDPNDGSAPSIFSIYNFWWRRARIPVIQHEFSESNRMCTICLEDIGHEDYSQVNESNSIELDPLVRQLPCGHVYHDECITPWLTRRHPSCPLCKYVLL